LPGLDVAGQTLFVKPAGTGAYDGFLTEGLLGYDFLSLVVLDIDYDARVVHLCDPRRFTYSGPGDSLELIDLDQVKVPFVRAKIAQPGRQAMEGEFILDTGARVSLTVNSPFVDDHKLLQYSPANIDAIVGGGAGPVGEARQRVTRLEKLEFGRFNIANLVAGFSQDKTGPLASKDFDGVIGGEILRRFHVILDYSHHRVILAARLHAKVPDAGISLKQCPKQ